MQEIRNAECPKTRAAKQRCPKTVVFATNALGWQIKYDFACLFISLESLVLAECRWVRHLWNSRFLDTHSQFYQRFPRWRTAFVNGKRRQPGPDSPKNYTPENPSFVGPHLSREVVTGGPVSGVPAFLVYPQRFCPQISGILWKFINEIKANAAARARLAKKGIHQKKYTPHPGPTTTTSRARLCLWGT